MIKLTFGKSRPWAIAIRFGIIIWIAAVFIFRIDLTKLIFKKTVEELKGPNITETMTSTQYSEALKILNTPTVTKTPEVIPVINNERETALTINNNRVFVPVTIGYRGKMVTVPLLIDTGATGVTISPFIARRLGIKREDTIQGISTLADGRKTGHYTVDVAFVAVGPKTKKPLQINIMPTVNEEEDGLLGMSFLGDFPYVLDMRAQEIKWL